MSSYFDRIFQMRRERKRRSARTTDYGLRTTDLRTSDLLFPTHQISAAISASGATGFLGHLDVACAAHPQRLLVPADDCHAVGRRIGFGFVGGHHSSRLTGWFVVAPAFVVVHVIDQRRAQHEALWIARVEIELLYAAQILLCRGGAHFFEQGRVASSDYPKDRVVEVLTRLKVIPARRVERLSKSRLVRSRQRRQHVLNRLHTEAVFYELKTRLKNSAFDFHFTLTGFCRGCYPNGGMRAV